MSAQGRWVNIPGKGERWQMPDGSLRHMSPQGQISWGSVGQALSAPFRGDPQQQQRARAAQQAEANRRFGNGVAPASAPSAASNPGNDYQSRFANRREEYHQMAQAGIQVGPPKSGNTQPPGTPAWTPPAAPPPPGGGSVPPAQRTAARIAATAPASVGAGSAPAVDATKVAGTPIAPGARDLADASAQLAALGLGRGSSGAGAGMDWKAAFATGAPGVDASKMAGGWQPEPGAFNGDAPVDGQVAFGANAPQLNLATGDVTAGNFNPTTAVEAVAGGGDLESRRRRAFLDAPDSLEGMRRARLVVADEIAAQGGDLQKFAADSHQMRPMSMKQLEGYLGQLKNGQTAASTATPAATTASPTATHFTMPEGGLEPVQGFEYGGPRINLPGVAAFDPSKQAFSMTAAADQALRARGQEAFKAAGTATLPYQTNQQAVPGVSGEANPAALSALATAGVDARGLTPPEMGAMYGATNALALGLGAPKAGATTKLPMLTPEQVEEARRMQRGPSFVTPPAGFNFYNR